MHGVIAEYEQARIAERYNSHRRVVPARGGPARIEIFEPEAEIVRWIFDPYVEKGCSIHQIAFDLADRGIPLADGIWGSSAITRLLGNEAYIGTAYYNGRDHFDGAGPRDARNGPLLRAPARGMDTDPGSGDRRPRHLRPRQAGQPRELEVEPTRRRIGRVAVARADLGAVSVIGCTCHRMRGATVPGTAATTAGQDPLRSSAGKRLLPGTQHPRRRIRRERVRASAAGAT
jgi:hypothetical protein